MKLVIWGTGNLSKLIEPYILGTAEIVAFVDNNEENWRGVVCRNKNIYEEIQIRNPDDLGKLIYDYIIIAVVDYREIKKQCVEKYGIPEKIIICAEDLSQYEKEFLGTIFDTNILADNNFYKISGREVSLDEGHTLPRFQKEHPMYDRFFPYLADITAQKKGEWIIDIGANIGDTVMAMWDYTPDKFLCVEPVKQFYDLLIKNLYSFGNNARIEFEQAFISDKAENYFADIYKGGSAVKCATMTSKGSAPTKRLDGLVKEKNIEPDLIDLIKIDTDGFDSDCIVSAKEILKATTGLIYWENQISDYDQFFRYQPAYNLLKEAGYTAFFIFDNTGNYLCKGTINTLWSINEYLQRINEGWSRVTFHYIDVLGCKDTDINKCEYTINEYLKQYILQRRKNGKK